MISSQKTPGQTDKPSMVKNKLNPHDRFIKALMTNKKVITEFFQTHLPDHIKDVMDLDSIELQKTSFIDDKLRLQVADLLYSVQIKGEPSYLYLLLEHQSTPDKLMPWRLLKYMVAIADHHLKKLGGSKLPFIYPLVLYNGEKPYIYSMDLTDLFEDQKELARETLANPFHLIDLTQVPDEMLKKYLYFGTMALIAKHIHDKDLLPFFKEMLTLFKELENQGQEEYIYISLSYMMEAGEVSSPEEFMQAVKRLETLNEEKVMTLAERFRMEGEARGKSAGILEGEARGEARKAHSIALRMLKRGVSMVDISEDTGLPVTEIEKLKTQLH